jgi:hypothetical protein
MKPFDKFAWLKALQSDPRYTGDQQRLGSIICVQFARRDGTGWATRLDDIAEKMPGGMSRSAMKTALGKLVRDGYLQETGRSLGGRGVGAWRSHNLTKPDHIQVRVLGETRPRTNQNPTTYESKPDQILGAKTSSELGEDPPKGTYKGTSIGDSPPEISDGKSPGTASGARCPRHAHIANDDHVPNCVACGAARRAAEEREREHEQSRQALRAAIRKAIDDCDDCDEYGRLDTGGNCPNHTNFRNRHQGIAELEEGTA